MYTYKVKLFAIAKDEAAYLSRWVHHHLYFGFDKIEIWLNNTTDNSVRLMDSIVEYNSAVSYEVADDFLNSCKKENKLFQVEAYRQAYAAAKEEGFDYILFLDVDEYWVPKDFKTNIKEFLEKFEFFDSISFQWYFDYPDVDTALFSYDIKESNRVCQNRHVKSLLKVSENLLNVSIHNSVFENGVYHLYDGGLFNQDDKKEQFSRSKVTKEYFEKNRGKVNHCFVYHCAFRSQKEYVASLLRGRAHVKDDSVLKVNRDGYLPEKLSDGPVDFIIPLNDLSSYYKSFFRFLSLGDVCFHDLLGKKFLRSRFDRVVELISDDSSLAQKHKRLFDGITLPEVTEVLEKAEVDLLCHVDSADLGNDVSVKGWVFKGDYSESVIEFVLSDGDKDISPHKVVMINRPDVQEVIDNKAPLQCGFKVLFDSGFIEGKKYTFKVLVDKKECFSKVLSNGLFNM